MQRCGSLQRGEPCDTWEDYGRCIVHGGGFPDAMFPAIDNANMRILQGAGLVAISYELIHDTRIIPIGASPQRDQLSENIRMYMGDARRPWEGTTLVVETTNLKANTRGSSPALRLVERFTRPGATRSTIGSRSTTSSASTPWLRPSNCIQPEPQPTHDVAVTTFSRTTSLSTC